GRSKSLAASLSYGFANAFEEEESAILALLHLFSQVVRVDALTMMGNPALPWSIGALRGLSPDRVSGLLDRAAEIGLLNAQPHQCYGMHPALSWYFRKLFERYFPENSGEADRARHAFAAAMSILGNTYHGAIRGGHGSVLLALAADEEN